MWKNGFKKYRIKVLVFLAELQTLGKEENKLGSIKRPKQMVGVLCQICSCQKAHG